jgi:hypothetical protein
MKYNLKKKKINYKERYIKFNIEIKFFSIRLKISHEWDTK